MKNQSQGCIAGMAIFLSAMLFVQPQANAQTYCTDSLTYYGCEYGSSIESFHLSDLHHESTGCTGGMNAADFTSLTCTLAQGETYLLSYTSNSFYATNDYLGIWVDLNHDFDFEDADEFIYSSISGNFSPGFLPISSTAPTGQHRMRVRLINTYSPILGSESCSNFNQYYYQYYYYGETHDYTVNIVPPPPCPGISFVSVNNITLHTADVSWDCGECSGSFVIEYGLPGLIPGTDAAASVGGTAVAAVDISAAPLTLTGLAPSTDYQLYVRRNCGAAGFSSNYGPIAFTTAYDVCATLTTISCGMQINATISAGKGAIDSTACSFNSGKELLYAFTPAVTGVYTITIFDGSIGYASYLFKEAASGCNESGWQCASLYPWDTYTSGPNIIIMDTLQAGTEYYLCVDALYDFYGAAHTFQIDCYSPFNPCAGISNITCGEPQQVTLPAGLGAWKDYSSFTTLFGKEKIYRFTPAVTGIYTLSINSTSGYYGAYYSFKPAAQGCDANGWHFIVGIDNISQPNNTFLMGTLIGGMEYYVLVDARTLYGTDQNFQINCYEPYSPCVEIETISCGTPVNFSVSAGAGGLMVPGCANNYATDMIGKEKIYQFTPSTSGTAALRLLSYPGNWNYTIKYYIKKASLGCNESGWTCFTILNSFESQIIPFPLIADTAYYVLVDVGEIGGNSQIFEITCPQELDPCSSVIPISCGTPVTATIPAGIGNFDFENDGYYDWTLGKEMIYSFTPTFSGTHQLDVINTNYESIYYFVKNAADGCNAAGWTKIVGTSYPSYPYSSAIYFPYPLMVGETYYIMLDASRYQGAEHEFSITCPAEVYNPCTTISAIHCDTPVSFSNSEGFGLFDPDDDNYYYFNPGRENIFEFTPALSGNYSIVLQASIDNYNVSYYVKQASDGCNNNNWQRINSLLYSGDIGNIPVALQAGVSYYMMADGFTPGQTIQFVCPLEEYNPCVIVTIPACDTWMTTAHAPGLGALSPENNCFDGNSAGRENIFSFTPNQSGLYGLFVDAGATEGIKYFIKEAASGCNNDGWVCIGGAGSYATIHKIPFALIAGTTYYILADPSRTLGVSQNFKILCPSPDPCATTEAITACEWDNQTAVNLPAGIGHYELPEYPETPQHSIGTSKIFSVTPAASGNYRIQTNTYSWNGVMHFFVKKAAQGCNGENWIPLRWYYQDMTEYLPFPLLKDSTYYILVAADFPGELSFNFYLSCPVGQQQYADKDGDGYGNPNDIAFSEVPLFGFTFDNTDCDDMNSNINPGAIEIAGNNMDDNCDGVIDNNVCDGSLNVTIAIEPLPEFCQSETITLSAQPSGLASYAWSTAETTSAIEASANGVYAVTVSDANGCTAIASFDVADLKGILSESLSGYTIIVQKEVNFFGNNIVEEGGVGSVMPRGKVITNDNSNVKSFGRAELLFVRDNSLFSHPIYSRAEVTLPEFEQNPYCGSGQTINIRDNSRVTLSGSLFKSITIGKNCTVTFTSSEINLDNLYVKENSIIAFAAPCVEMKICRRLYLVGNNSFNSTIHDLTVFVEQDVTIGPGSDVTADVYMRSGKFTVKGGTQSAPNFMRGLFIANVMVADGSVYWYQNDGCNDCVADDECDYEEIKVYSFTLVNAATDADIGMLHDGDVIDLAVTPQISVRANVCEDGLVESVRFLLNGANYKMENLPFYTIAGDNNGNYLAWHVQPGVYTITAAPFSGNNGTGTAGIDHSVTITIINSGAAKMDEQKQNPSASGGRESVTQINAYPNPFSDKLNIEFTLAEDSRVKLEIFNLAGHCIDALFEGNVKAGELQKHEFTPDKLADGMLIYRLQTENESYYGKAVMVR